MRPGLFVLAVFMAVWVISALTEYDEAAAFNSKVLSFLDAGGRFTSEQGEALEARVKALEELHGQ